MPDLTRRNFIQLTVLGSAVGASSLLAEGCRNERIWRQESAGAYGGENNKALPYVNMPDGMDDGVPQYFATTCAMCPAGCGLFVRTMGGRAVKVEGNPAHPVNAGKTCARAQASLQHLYNPDRLRFPVMRASREDSPDQATWDTALEQTAKALGAGGAAILLDSVTVGRSPSLMKLVREFAAKFGAPALTFGLLDDAPWRAAARMVYGRDQVPAYRLSEADFILAFNSNFLECWPSPVYYGREFGEFRQGARRSLGEHGRFYFIGSRMSMTAAKADRWIPCNPTTEGVVAVAVAMLLKKPSAPVEQASADSGVSVPDLQMLAQRFRGAGYRALAVAGDGLAALPDATGAFLAVESLNQAVSSRCVGFGNDAVELQGDGRSHLAQLEALMDGIGSGRVRSLLVLGQPNPVFALTRAYGVEAMLKKALFVAAVTPFLDETSRLADVALPSRTFLESWDDNVPLVQPPGQKTAGLRQPIIDPSFVRTHDVYNNVSPMPWMDTRETADILIDLAKRAGKPLTGGSDARDAVRRTWATIGQADLKTQQTDNDRAWVGALANGGYRAVDEIAYAQATYAIDFSHKSAGNMAGVPFGNRFALHLFPHIYWSDGRHSNLNWLQEIPDPMTSAVWNNWIEISLPTAEQMGIRTGDVLRIRTEHGCLDAPAFPTPGLHPRTLAMPIGNGHAPDAYGRNPRGSNPLVILNPAQDNQTGALAYNGTVVTLEKLRDAQAGWNGEGLNTLVLTQDRPGGQEPEEVKRLIHTMAKEWRNLKAERAEPENQGLTYREAQ